MHDMCQRHFTRDIASRRGFGNDFFSGTGKGFPGALKLFRLVGNRPASFAVRYRVWLEQGTAPRVYARPASPFTEGVEG
jgi:hypothetical protein